MGDRAVVQLESNSGRVSPCLYLHWGGSEVPKLLEELHDRFIKRRGDDLRYGFARLVGYVHEKMPTEVTGMGIWNQTTRLTPADSQGDAGVFVFNISTLTVYYGGGYAPKALENSALTYVRTAGDTP